MAEWKKVVVSGSTAALSTLTLDNVLASSSGGTGLNLAAYTSATGGQVIALKSDKSGLEFTDDSSQFTAAGISGSLGTNADLIRTLTAAGISGSLGTNADLIRTLTAASISGSNPFTASSISGSLGTNADLIRTLTAAGISGSLGTNADLIRTLTAASITGSSANKLPLAGGTMTGGINMNGQDITGVKNLEVQGDLNVAGTASFTNSTNLAVADKYILLNSGSSTTGDGGIVIQQATNGIGDIFGFDKDKVRFGMTSSFDSNTAGDFVPDAFVAAVIDSGADMHDSTDPDTVDARYKKNGNIFVSEGTDDIYIYVEDA